MSDRTRGLALGPHFEVYEQLGAGGMGVVYRARDLQLDRVVAVKFLPSHRTARDRLRFQREARLSAQLTGPHTVRVFAIGTADDGTPYYVMEYADGGTLRELLDTRGAFTVSETLALGQALSAGLADAHSRGLVHRDVKPANILFLTDTAGSATPKLGDFGLARPVDGDAERHTTPGTVLGSPAYMAPEQGRGEEPSAAADVYSLGVVLYELLTGATPFSASDMRGWLAAHQTITPRPPSAIRPNAGVPPALDGVVMRCLEKDPSRRFATGAELKDALASLGETAGGLSLRTAVAGPLPSPISKAHLRVPVLVCVRIGVPEGTHPDTAESWQRALEVAVQEVPWGAALAELGFGYATLALGIPVARESDGQRAVEIARTVVNTLLARGVSASAAVDVGACLVRFARHAAHRRDRPMATVELSGRPAASVRELAHKLAPGDVALTPAAEDAARGAFELARGGAHALVLGPAELGAAARPHAARKLPFVGQSTPLAALHAALRSGLDSGRAVIWIEGRRGAGKTRLVHEVLARLREEGIALSPVVFECTSPQCAPLEPVVRAVRAKTPENCSSPAKVSDPQSTQGATEDYGAALGSPATVYTAMRDALGSLAGSPRAVVVEDFQWADKATAAFVGELCERVGAHEPGIVIVLTRPEDRPGAADWTDLLAAASDALCRLELRPLSPDETLALARHALAREGVEAELRARQIAELAQGTPGLVEEYTHAGVATKTTRSVDSPSSLVESLALRVQAEFDRLGLEVQETLRCAALVGATVWPGAVDAAAGEERAPWHFEELRRAGWLRARVTSRLRGEAELAFVETPVAEALRAQWHAPKRRAAHERVAAWLRSRPEAADLAVELGEHCEAAGAPDEALVHFAAAARSAWQRGAAQLAAHTAGRWLALAPKSHPERQERLVQWAIAAARTGDTREAMEVLQRAGEDTGTDVNTRVRALEALGTLFEQQNTLSEAREAYEKARVFATHARWVALTARLARLVARSGELGPALALCNAALAAAGPGSRERAHALHVQSTLLRKAGELDLALAAGQESAAILESIGDFGAMGTALNNLAVLAMSRGEAKAALQLALRAAQQHGRAGALAAQALSLANAGEILLGQGEAERALPHLDAAIRLAKATGALEVLEEASKNRARCDALGSR
jgi:tetratricopeptide (TPR) repeat protein